MKNFSSTMRLDFPIKLFVYLPSAAYIYVCVCLWEIFRREYGLPAPIHNNIYPISFTFSSLVFLPFINEIFYNNYNYNIYNIYIRSWMTSIFDWEYKNNNNNNNIIYLTTMTKYDDSHKCARIVLNRTQ